MIKRFFFCVLSLAVGSCCISGCHRQKHQTDVTENGSFLIGILRERANTASVILLCRTEVKGKQVRFKLLEVWKGSFNPELLIEKPEPGYLEYTFPYQSNMKYGSEVLVFYQKQRSQLKGKDILVPEKVYVFHDGKMDVEIGQPSSVKQKTIDEIKALLLSSTPTE